MIVTSETYIHVYHAPVYILVTSYGKQQKLIIRSGFSDILSNSLKIRLIKEPRMSVGIQRKNEIFQK